MYMRVLGRVRLSRLTEESTSAARQRELIENWAQTHGHEVIGWAEDLEVSGSIDPFEAPALREWWERESEWDIMCAWKLDRIGRRAIPLNKVFGWMIEHDKTLVCVSDQIDLSHWVGRLVANVIAGVAEGELEAIRERNKASRRKLLEDGRWPGGHAPYGFVTVPHPSGGWRLGHNREEVAVIRSIADRVCGGEAVDAVSESYGLLPSTVWRMLRSRYLMGHATYEGRTVRDRAGMPVLNAEPILGQEEWDRLQKALDARKKAYSRTRGASVMIGIAYCPICDAQLYSRLFKRKYGPGEYRYYYCPNKHGRNIPAEKVEQLVFDTFLEQFGDDPVLERVYVPAENHQNELDAAVRAVDELTPILGAVTSATMRSRLTEQLRALDFEISRLEQLPSRPAGWEWRETGATFKTVWPTATDEEKRKMIIDAQITVKVIREKKDIDFYIETQKSPLRSVKT